LVFNIFRQQPRDAFFQVAKERKIALIARGPLASGLLGGEITGQTIFPENDHRNYNRNGEAFDVGDTFSGVNFERGLCAVDELRKILPSEFSLSHLALKWILMHQEITVVIPGAINEEQVAQNAVVSDLDDISDLMPKIREIYKTYIESDVHDRWI
jgi:aryl-alcohol dehydrogenase-like predicted oxidoreductase